MTKLDIAFLERFTDQIGPVGKSLGMLIRPTFIAAPGKTLVWGDWSAIEARVLPWLAASPGAQTQLDIFLASDHDKTRPDVYVFNAAQLLGVDPQVMWDAFLEGEKWAKDGRQSHGKVPVLSLGFGGGVGALMKMAINYKVYLDEATAQKMVDGWRAANQWAPAFWGKFHVDRHGNVDQASGLWGAVNMALRNPGTAYPAGRVAYVFDESYMGGTLFCALPCGRLLTYPDCRVRTRQVKDKDSGEVSEKTAIWYRKGYGWSALWHGKAAENITQAVAGSILRETLKQLDLEFTEFDVVRQLWALDGEADGPVGHTHDEGMLEVRDTPEIVALAHEALEQVMGKWRPAWRETLPLTAEIVDNWYYTKAIG